MLRHSVFALILVGAAFAGGAAINGPGLAWLQRTILGGPTIIVEGTPGSASTASKKLLKPFPTATSSPPLVNLPRAPEPEPEKSAAGPSAGEVESPLPPESPSAPASALIRPVEPAAPKLGPALGPSPAPAPAPAPTPALVKKGPAAPNLRPVPKTDPVARLASAGSPATPDWVEIRNRMRSLGISRYSIEAEVDGRVRFSCLIPVDGLRAVGHHFEAEGDDEAQAAETALRRVALWQATEAPARKD